MLGGFDPRQEQLFFARRRRQALAWALLLFGLLAMWVATQEGPEETVTVALEPEIKDFEVEEEKEPEVEEEPPPPPPQNTQVKVTNKPKPKPKIKPPDQKPTDTVPESNQEKTIEVPGGGQPGGTGEKPVDKPKPKPKAAEPKPKPVEKPKPAAEKIDPTKPIDRPERASMPKPEPGNKMPDYPEELRDAGITGEVVMKLHIHMDGSVKGAKILRKKSTAATDEEKTNAEKLFVAAVIKVIKTWKYEPAKLDGEPISIWFPVNFPFSLTGG